jgi:hypothetical protein
VTVVGSEEVVIRYVSSPTGIIAQDGHRLRPPNDTLAKLQTASHTSGDAARPLPRLTNALAEAICNGRDAVANESAEALQRRARESAVCQLQLVVRPHR